ncbi:phosphodiesterase/alkaline phosphatase D-like protein [Bradyrhizobium sp. i1.4.4]
MIDMRSYRDDSWNKGEDHRGWILGAEQLAWLKRELAASRATWKVIAADLPIGLVSLDAVALGNGAPDRREHEVADLLASIKHAGVRNIVWLTADMHYTAAHYYDPNKAQFQDFEPFWEFVSGPLPAPGVRASSTIRLARSRCTRTAAARRRGRTLRRASACSSSAGSISTVRAA